MAIEQTVSEKRNDKDKIEELALRAKESDKFAFVELAGIFFPFIRAQAKTYNLPDSELDDLCQEGRIALHRAVCKYDSDKLSFITYAKTCIKNAMTSFVRAYCAENKINVGSVSLDDSDNDYSSFTSDDMTPEDTIIAKEFISELETAMATILSESERTVLKYKLSGIGVAEISVIAGKDTKSVENTLFRARKKLKEYLTKIN